MKDYKEITPRDIEKMSLAELNESIAAYAKKLQYRLERLERARTSGEKAAAIRFISNTTKNIYREVDLTGLPLPNSPTKEFQDEKEARARLKNLVSNLRSPQSTVRGQMVSFRHRRIETRKYIAKTQGKKTASKLTKADLELLGYVFRDLGHGREKYSSGETIDAFTIALSLGYGEENMSETVRKILEGIEVETAK